MSDRVKTASSNGKEHIYSEDDELFLSISNLTDDKRKSAKEIIMLLDKYDKEVQ